MRYAITGDFGAGFGRYVDQEVDAGGMGMGSGGGGGAAPAAAPGLTQADVMQIFSDHMGPLSDQLSELSERFQQPQPGLGQPAGPQFDPYDTGTYQPWMQSLVEQQVTERVSAAQQAMEAAIGQYEERWGMYQPILEQVAQQHVDQQLSASFDALAKEEGIGEFNRSIADRIAKFNLTRGMDGVTATRQAAMEAAKITREIEEQTRASIGQHLGGLPQPTPTGGGTPAAPQPGVPAAAPGAPPAQGPQPYAGSPPATVPGTIGQQAASFRGPSFREQIAATVQNSLARQGLMAGAALPTG